MIPFFNYPALFEQRKQEYLEVISDVLVRGAYIMQKDLIDFEESLADYLNVEHAIELPLGGQDGRICGKAVAKGLKCVNLWSRLFTDYHLPDGNGLYLDGAHLTVTGSKKVALWMAIGDGAGEVTCL